MESYSTYLKRGMFEFNKGHSVSSKEDTMQVNGNVGCCNGLGDMIKAELNQGIPSGNGERWRRENIHWRMRAWRPFGLGTGKGVKRTKNNLSLLSTVLCLSPMTSSSINCLTLTCFWGSTTACCDRRSLGS